MFIYKNRRRLFLVNVGKPTLTRNVTIHLVPAYRQLHQVHVERVRASSQKEQSRGNNSELEKVRVLNSVIKKVH